MPETFFGLFGVFILIWVLLMAAIVATTVLWIVVLIEVVKIPDHQFRAAGTEKTTWLLVVVLAGQIGAVIWWFAKRQEVKAFDGLLPPPVAATPPGWYPDPSTGQQRWWDGQRWV